MVSNDPAYAKAYYEKNKKRIANLMKQKVHCDVCDKEVTKHNYPRHKTSSAHMNIIKEQQQEKFQKEALLEAVDRAVAKALKKAKKM